VGCLLDPLDVPLRIVRVRIVTKVLRLKPDAVSSRMEANWCGLSDQIGFVIVVVNIDYSIVDQEKCVWFRFRIVVVYMTLCEWEAWIYTDFFQYVMG
jgi:hypothetical protein